MSQSSSWFSDLQALRDSAFPKRYRSCGRSFANAADYFAGTLALRPGVQGLKSAADDDGTVIVEAFRNCSCGSTLLCEFANRRDPSPAGIERRERFAKLLQHLMDRGMPRSEAHIELTRALSGSSDEHLRGLLGEP